MVWSENFHFKPFPNSRAKRERDHTQRERDRTQSPSLFNFDFESHPNRTKRDRQWTQSPEPFDFAPFDFAIRQRDRIAPRSHRGRSLANPEPFNFAVRQKDRIAPRSHRERSLANLEPISHLQLRQDRTPGSHRDGTDRTDQTEIAIEKWLGFDEFGRIWWIFFGWVLFLCLSIEKLYYIFVWKLRKCEE